MKTIMVLTALLCMAVFCGCTDDSKGGDDIDTSMPDFKNHEGFLSAELERRILQDYVDGGGAGASRISGYCGAFNGWVVVKVDFPNAQVIPTVTIGGYNFDNLPPIIAWKDGQIYELRDAYDAGLLTYYNLRTISTMSGLGEFEGLSAELEWQILLDFAKVDEQELEGAVIWSSVIGYYGTYNGWVVVRMGGGIYPQWGGGEPVTIGGFNFDVLKPIMAWKDGQIYELRDAYDLGLLTQDDLRTIYTMSRLGGFEGLSAELEWRILLDFAKVNEQELAEGAVIWGSVIGYYGAYNGWVVVRMGGGIYLHGGPELVTIGGFNFDVSKPIIVWKDGQIYELRDAYDAGLLTQDDVGSIYTMSRLGGFEGLSAELEWRILQDYVDGYKEKSGYDESVEGLELTYYGAYNGWVVAMIMVPFASVGQLVAIGGYIFNALPPIIAWKDGQIHELKAAYDLGLLTQDDVGSIAKCPPHRYLNNF